MVEGPKKEKKLLKSNGQGIGPFITPPSRRKRKRKGGKEENEYYRKRKMGKGGVIPVKKNRVALAKRERGCSYLHEGEKEKKEASYVRGGNFYFFFHQRRLSRGKKNYSSVGKEGGKRGERSNTSIDSGGVKKKGFSLYKTFKEKSHLMGPGGPSLRRGETRT